VQSKPNVLIYTIATTPERMRQFKWVGEINLGKVVVYCLKDRPIKLRSLDDAKAYRVGAIFQDFRHDYLLRKGFVEGTNLESTSTHDLNYAKLKAGRIDLWPMDVAVMAYYVRHAGDDPGTALTPLLDMPELDSETHFSMAFGLETPDEMVDLFRRGLQKIKDDGTYDAILRKWRR
jgi:polar amino acid transport system substrate-binding protein